MSTKTFSRRDFLKLVGASSVGIAAAACQPVPMTAVPEGKVAEEAKPAAEAITLELWAPHPLDDNIKVTDFVRKNFEPQHPGVQFKFTRVPSEWEQKFRTAAAGGTLPDLFAVDGINVPAYTARGLTAEIEGIDPKLLDDFYPSARAEMEWRGKVYASVLETNSQALRVNMDMLEKADVPVPTTWDELVTYGQQLTIDQSGKKANEPGFDPNALRQAAFETWCCRGEGATWMILGWIWTNGGDVYDANKKVTIAEPPAVEAIQFLSDLIKKYYIWPKAGVMQAGPEGTWYGQLVAMGETGAFDLANLTQVNPPKFKWDIAPVPPKTAGGKFVSGVGGWLISAYRQGKHIPEAIEFLKFMMSDEWQLHTSKYGYALTGRKSIAEQRLAEVPQLKIFIEAMLAGKARPRSSEYPAITDALQQAFDESIFGDRPPQDALSDAARKIEEALAKEIPE
ncbi:MAG: extracellular solute-binding protein [Anaerolineae bacterium]|nr:extracellular solute-binding protein [Anaerolineae bacterium]MDW8097947.1 extracellular solute-binding protein [Anaerolineae bacterium]